MSVSAKPTRSAPTQRYRNSLYDSYVRSIRWASDRIGRERCDWLCDERGFSSTANRADGLRKCLVDEFSSIYVFHLRGLRNARTSGEQVAREGREHFRCWQSSAHRHIFARQKSHACHTTGTSTSTTSVTTLAATRSWKRFGVFGGIAGISEARGWQTSHQMRMVTGSSNVMRALLNSSQSATRNRRTP